MNNYKLQNQTNFVDNFESTDLLPIIETDDIGKLLKIPEHALSSRTVNILRANGFNTIGQLLTGIQPIGRLAGVGEKTKSSLFNALLTYASLLERAVRHWTTAEKRDAGVRYTHDHILFFEAQCLYKSTR